MKKLLCCILLTMRLAACSTTGGKNGEVSVNAAVDPNDPTHVQVNLGGKIYFRQRPSPK